MNQFTATKGDKALYSRFGLLETATLVSTSEPDWAGRITYHYEWRATTSDGFELIATFLSRRPDCQRTDLDATFACDIRWTDKGGMNRGQHSYCSSVTSLRRAFSVNLKFQRECREYSDRNHYAD